MHDVVAWIHDLVEWSANMHLRYKLLAYYNFLCFWGIIWLLWYSCCITYGFNDCEFCIFFTLFCHSMAQYDKFEKCSACIMTVWVECGDRGLALHVGVCSNNTQRIHIICCQVLVCFDIVEHVLQKIVVWLELFIWRVLVYQMRPVVHQFFCFVWCLAGTKSNRHGSNWHEFSRNQQHGVRSVVMHDVMLSRDL